MYFFFFSGRVASVSVSRVSAVQYRLLETLQCHFTSTQRAVDAFSEIYNRL